MLSYSFPAVEIVSRFWTLSEKEKVLPFSAGICYISFWRKITRREKQYPGIDG